MKVGRLTNIFFSTSRYGLVRVPSFHWSTYQILVFHLLYSFLLLQTTTYLHSSTNNMHGEKVYWSESHGFRKCLSKNREKVSMVSFTCDLEIWKPTVTQIIKYPEKNENFRRKSKGNSKSLSIRCRCVYSNIIITTITSGRETYLP